MFVIFVPCYCSARCGEPYTTRIFSFSAASRQPTEDAVDHSPC